MSGQTNKGKFHLTATAASIGALVIWALGPNFIKYLTAYLDAWTQNLLRYSVACLFWLPFLAWTIRSGQLDKDVWRRAILPAGANVIMQSLWAAAFYYIDPAFMALLSKTSNLWIAAFALIFFPDERALLGSMRFWLGLGLCIIGVTGVLYFKGDFVATGTTTGVLISLGCSAMWGVYTVAVRAAFRNVDSRSGFSVISIYTVAGLAVAALLFGDVRRCATLGPRQWMVVIVSAVLCIALAHVFYYAAIKRIGATIPSLIILAQPFAVFAISHFAFGESMNLAQLLSGIILLIGAALSIWAQTLLPADYSPAADRSS